MNNPHQITKEFEAALCEYTGAKYAVAVNSCTMAIFLAAKWIIDKKSAAGEPVNVFVPARTYIGVAQSLLHAGAKKINFVRYDWSGYYVIDTHAGSNDNSPLNPVLVDSARRFTSGMYKKNQFRCVSFHATKILGDSQGGAILHDNKDADEWFRRARFDGRREGVHPTDDNPILGWHCYMSPDVAARLLWKLPALPLHNEDLPNDDYPDLSKFEIFK